MGTLEGKNIVVTGGSRGIGAGIVTFLAQQGRKWPLPTALAPRRPNPFSRACRERAMPSLKWIFPVKTPSRKPWVKSSLTLKP